MVQGTPGPLILPNPVNQQLTYMAWPRVAPSAFLAPTSVLTGDVTVAADTYVGFGVIISGNWAPIFVGPRTNLQSQVNLHGKGGLKGPVLIGPDVSVLHGASLHGPCRIGANTFIGQMVNLFDAEVGRDCVIQHGALLTGGVKIPDGRVVRPGQVVDQQAIANQLPAVPADLVALNQETVQGYLELGRGYRQLLAEWC